MRLISARAWAFVVLSALLQIVIFPVAGPLPVWREAIAWVALVPLLLALLEPDRSGKPMSVRIASLIGYACGILWYMGNCYWIYQTMHLYGGLPETVAFVILILFALYLGLYHALFAALIGALRTSRFGVRGTLVVMPFVWVAVELARARVTFFPWDLLGYSQVDNRLLTPLAPFAGVMGISFAIASGNAALVAITLARPRRIAMAIGGGFICLLQYAYLRDSPRSLSGAEPSTIAVMMQENVEVGAVGKAGEQLTTQQELAQFSAATLHPDNVDSFSGQYVWDRSDPPVYPTIVIWPEAPSHFFSSDPYFRSYIGHLALTAKSPAIVGSLGVDRSSVPARGYYLYDSASIFNADGQYVGRYDKIHLVPWGEYIPFKQFFAFADKLTEGVGDMDRGYKRDVFSLGGHAYGVFVCYESIFGDEVRQFANNGAEVLVNISDDGWYGDSGAPWQHLNMARMRAIENRRWLLRDTNTGVTTAIDPYGRMAAQAPRHVRGAYAFPFAFTPAFQKTYYTRHGDWFAWLCAAVTILALILSHPSFPVIRVKHPSAG